MNPICESAETKRCAGCEAELNATTLHFMVTAPPPHGGALLCVHCTRRMRLDPDFESDVLNAIAIGTTWPHVKRVYSEIGAEPPRSAADVHAQLGAMTEHIELMSRLMRGRQ